MLSVKRAAISALMNTSSLKSTNGHGFHGLMLRSFGAVDVASVNIQKLPVKVFALQLTHMQGGCRTKSLNYGQKKAQRATT